MVMSTGILLFLIQVTLLLPGDSHRFRDHKNWSWHGKLHKAQNVSCDTYFYVLSYRMGIEKMNTWMRQFGFGEKLA